MIRKHVVDVFLHPGEYFVGGADCRIRTLLGSCVSITLWHPVKRVGGMSHFLLPTRVKDTEFELDGRYGEEAMVLLMDELILMKAPPEECQAKIFGGGNMFPGHRRTATFDVGQRNGEGARTLLNYYGIPIVSENLFGTGLRQIIFDVFSGDVWIRRAKPIEISLHQEKG